ncbi:MAG TPA: trypsin-like serine protease, partial [Polyangiaceae bacterium]|nr:trypsin-like serine protease [Polyangiaceae bacterium]
IRVAALLAPMALSACTQATDAETSGSGAPLGASAQAIIDGAPADEAKYGAVGAVVWFHPDFGVVQVFCSGTLVGPTAIVTARHCTPDIDLAPLIGVQAAFAFGPDGYNPTQLIPITGYVAAPAAPGKEKGLLLDGGRDVAVAHLQSPAVGVTPAKLGEFKDNQLGKQFQIAGYGVHASDFSSGQKFSGLATARAYNGRWYELLFSGDYEAYRQWYFSDSPSAARTEAEAKDWWKIYKLENKYELLAGGLPGESVSCYGDSGGPLLLGSNAANLTTYGVSFAGEGTISTVCGLGGGYLVFNRKMLDFVQGAL